MQILIRMLNSLGLQADIVFSSIATTLLIFIFTLIGSYLHEVYCLLRDDSDKIEIYKIIITSMTSTFVLFMLADTVIARWGYKGLVFTSFVAGAGGYKYIYKFYNGDILDIVLGKFGISLKGRKNPKIKDEEEEKEEEE